MLKTEQQMDLILRNTKGESIRSLARTTGLSRNTIRKYVRSQVPIVRRKPSRKRPEKLDPFKSFIIQRMQDAASGKIGAAILYREIKERGYAGGLTRVKEFLQDLNYSATAMPRDEALTAETANRSALAA